MGKPAARVGDMHSCPMVTGVVPHVGGPILPPGDPTVLIGGMPAARIGDMATCIGPPDLIISACATVLIGGKPAARLSDQTAHGGILLVGCLTVLLGEETVTETPRLILLCPDIKQLEKLPLGERFTAEQAIIDRLEQIAPDQAATLSQQRHDRDMGVLANAPYATGDGSSPVLPPNYSEVSDKEELIKLGVSNDLLDPDMKVYKVVGDNNKSHYVLSFRGTETGAGLGTFVEDAGVDILQGVGFKMDAYERANVAAKAMKLSGESVELTGHSKGGGQAATASAASGLPATTFNAAGVHCRTLERAGVTTEQLQATNTNIKAYSNERDPLNGAQDNRLKVLGAVGAVAAYLGGVFGAGVGALTADGALPPALGKRIVVPPTRDQGMGLLEGHSMETLVRAMDEQIDSKLKDICGC